MYQLLVRRFNAEPRSTALQALHMQVPQERSRVFYRNGLEQPVSVLKSPVMYRHCLAWLPVNQRD
jgi:hypothetical protein